MSMRRMIWRLLPTFLHRYVRALYFASRLLPNAMYDMGRFLRYSGLNRSRNYRGERAARIVMSYHQLEKGLSLASPRPGFGIEAAKRLMHTVQAFAADFGVVTPATTGLAVLHRYLAFDHGTSPDVVRLREHYRTLLGQLKVTEADVERWPGGTLSMSRSELESARNRGFAEFFASRHSVRHFSGQAIPPSAIQNAVELAQRSPSVCNRQAWRVHSFSQREDINKLLALQSGNRGFGEQSSVVLLVTCDLASFVDVGERYQAWIDGGMFSMSLCLALHWAGLGACCLNWSKERQVDKALRRIVELPEAEQVIMMIAVGTLPDHFSVACSPRLPLAQVLRVHSAASQTTQATASPSDLVGEQS